MAKKDAISFTAEIKQVNSKKTPSLDMEYRVTFIGDDPTINTLGLLSANTLVKVSVEVVE